VKFTEVEQKYTLLGDPGALRIRLRELGGTASEPARQVDTYFNAPHKDFLAGKPVVSEWLRLREEPSTASLNYKLWHPVDQAAKSHADEYESPVGDPEAIRHTLTALGFTEVGVVDKIREEWHVGKVAVAIDTVAKLGTFIEFEYKGDAKTVQDATTRLEEFIASLNTQLGERVNAGYPHLVLGIASV
jgi:adenylate cyclase class 2